MNKLLFSGGVLGLVSVIMGALGDHAFSIPLDKMHSLETAIRYNMIYSVMVVVIALAPAKYGLARCGVLFAVGTFLFSFFIYAALITGIGVLTYVTPLGGLTLMAGWGFLIYKSFSFRHL